MRQKWFYVIFSLWMAIVVLIGFWPGYFGPLATGNLDAQVILHIHAMVFVGWVVLFTLQAWKIYKGDLKSHRKWGRLGIYYGILLLITGVITGFIRKEYYLCEDMPEVASFVFMVSLRDMTGFLLLFGLAMYYRREPQLHKVWILGASAWLLVAAAARIAMNHFDGSDTAFYIIWLLPVFAGMAVEFHNTRRFPIVYAIMLSLMFFVYMIPTLIERL